MGLRNFWLQLVYNLPSAWLWREDWMRPLGSLDVQLTLSLKKGNCGDPFVYLRNIFIYFLQVLVFVEYHWHVFLALNKYLITGVLEAPPSLLYVLFFVCFSVSCQKGGWVGGSRLWFRTQYWLYLAGVSMIIITICVGWDLGGGHFHAEFHAHTLSPFFFFLKIHTT